MYLILVSSFLIGYVNNYISIVLFSFLEPFLEATPQVHITLILLGQDNLSFSDYFLWISFALSILSAAFGIAKLLKNGIIKLVRKDGKMGGYCTPGFILVMLTVACNIIGKGIWIVLGFFDGTESQRVTAAQIWVLVCLLPQFLLVTSKIFVCFA